MKIIGLTGSIGSGKSFVAAVCKEEGLAVFDADAAVHRLLLPDSDAFDAVASAFPETTDSTAIDRQKLGEVVFANEDKKQQLEHILHPQVRSMMQGGIEEAKAQGAAAIVLEIPLLFENGIHAQCDSIWVTDAPKALRAERVKTRPGMSDTRFNAIDAAQLNPEEKRKRADYVIDTSLEKVAVISQVREIIGKEIPKNA